MNGKAPWQVGSTSDIKLLYLITVKDVGEVPHGNRGKMKGSWSSAALSG
jgi:hypothetical protein